MSNEPKAGTGLDPELLAAYIDQRLTPEQRRRVEAQLANDPDNYAVLVETMKALDATAAATPRRPIDARRFVIAASVLAAAAALVLVIGMQPDWLRQLRGERSDEQLAPLIASADPERTIEGRLSGGFVYAPLRPVTRGTAPPENLSLLAAAGKLQQAVAENPRPETLHALGVALLLTGRIDEGISTLEQAAAQHSDARYKSDLAAAYAARAQQAGRAEDWARALTQSEAALALDPTLLEAWFNRALALDRMFLRSRAADAWQEYLKRDPNSPWAAEARAKLQNPPQSWDNQRRQLDQSGTAATVGVKLVASNPQLVREWIEETVLGGWAEAVIVGNDADARARLQQASQIVPLIAEAQKTDALVRVIGAIGSTRDPVRLAHAHQDFLAGRRMYLDGVFAESGERYQRAFASLAAAKSPLAQTCQLYIALLPYFRGQLEEAKQNLKDLERDFAGADPNTEGRRHWMIGIIEVGQGRYEPAIREYRAALKSFEASNESEGIAGLHSVLSEVLKDVGDAEWWQHLRRSTEYTPYVRIGRRNAVFVVGTQALLSAGYLNVARHYQEEALRNASDGGTPSMRVDAYLLLHTVLQRLGDRQASEETLKQAREWVNAIPDVGLRQRQENELVSLEVESALARNAGEATTLAANAINQFSAEGRTRRLPQLYLQLARARFRSNDLAGARNAIDQGLAAVDKQRVNVREARLRLSYFEEKWSLVEEGLAQRLVAADITASQSLAFLDKWRRPFFLAAPAKAGLTISPTLDDARAVVAYAMLPDKLVVWVMRGPNVERRVVNVTRHAIESQIANVKTLMAGARNETDAAGALTKLSQILLVPVADQLSGVRAIYISPDGVIGEVPFAALPLPSSDERLIDRAAVVMVPSVGADVEPASPLKTAKHVLIVAVSRAGDDELPELPGAADEARRVAAAYPGSTVDLHLDDLDADGFLRLAPSADTIHLAAHASINPLLPHLSRIYLKPSASHPSGILSAGEIAALTLQARLVVLAGCDTASGTPTRSEGVLGVTSAFLAAGAQTVVASLWPAEDRSSVAFQEHFHQSVAAGHSAAEALREAQLWARSNQTAVRPWSWAAWTVTQSHF